jgi:hypothetical protein
VSCRCPRGGFATIPGHYFQRHVNAGGDTRGGEEGAFLHEMQSSFDGDFWKQLLHLVKKTPVRSSLLAVEEPGFTDLAVSGRMRVQAFHLQLCGIVYQNWCSIGASLSSVASLYRAILIPYVSCRTGEGQNTRPRYPPALYNRFSGLRAPRPPRCSMCVYTMVVLTSFFEAAFWQESRSGLTETVGKNDAKLPNVCISTWTYLPWCCDRPTGRPQHRMSATAYAPSSALRKGSPCSRHQLKRMLISVPMQKWRTPRSR